MKEREIEAIQHKLYTDLATALNRFAILMGIFSILLFFLGLTFDFTADQTQPDSYMTIFGGTSIIVVGMLSLVLCFFLLRAADVFRKKLHRKNKEIAALLLGMETLTKSHHLLRLILILFVLCAALGVYRTVFF